MRDPNCIFCKIIAGEIPSKREYEDQDVIVINDIDPKAPHHYLMVFKDHVSRISALTPDQLQRWTKALQRVSKMEKELKLEGGFRLVINQGEDGGQSVPHLHVHVLSGKKMDWNPA